MFKTQYVDFLKNIKRLLTFDSICAIIALENGESELWNFLEDLRIKAETNKDYRIQYKQITFYIQLLQDNGTRMPENITKHIEDGIWELRPGNNRVLYFFFKDNTFILLHQFRKKTQKTPRSEIEKAKSERKDFLSREEHKL